MKALVHLPRIHERSLPLSNCGRVAFAAVAVGMRHPNLFHGLAQDWWTSFCLAFLYLLVSYRRIAHFTSCL